MTFTVLQTDVFARWLKRLRDPKATARILLRLETLSRGREGDTKGLGDGLSELRIHLSPGYRIYYLKKGRTMILLLCGGDKGSQKRDIERARKLAADVVEQELRP
jgi:putative addiction module killer protein